MRHVLPIALLVVSNVFMTFARYGQLEFGCREPFPRE
jgi:uncharacterized protein (DUF486 family)